MDAEIYYFSGSGNSLAVARDVAAVLAGKLISIGSLIDQDKIQPQAEIIGIVFPIYYEPFGGCPLIVRRFVGKLENIQASYIFAICTYGSGGVTSLKYLAELIAARGGKLAAGFRVNMPENMGGSKINTPTRQQKMFAVWKKNVTALCETVNTRKTGGFDTPNIFVGKAYALVKLLTPALIPYFKNMTLRHMGEFSASANLPYEDLMHRMDSSFVLNEKCTGCGICAQVCPVRNIELCEDRPVWQHHCEFCLACLHWCPQKAIDTRAFPGLVRYHHPDVKLSDMLRHG